MNVIAPVAESMVAVPTDGSRVLVRA
jgi:hypothetical protein